MSDGSGQAATRVDPLRRRGFLMASLISGFTLAATRAEAQPIHTDTDGLAAGEVRVPVQDGQLPGYYARPVSGGPFPLVVVNEEIFGVHEHIKDICRRLAKQGYAAIAVEYYARSGDLSKMTDSGQIVRDVVSKTPDAQIMTDLDAAVAYAAGNGGDANRLGVTGFCQGGRTTWLYAAHNPRLRAAVAWYGPLGGQTNAARPRTALDLAGEIKCPLLALYGGQDTGIPVADVRAAEARARAAGKTVEVVIYPDAGHAFNADYRPSYRRDAAEDGWRRMLAWFRANGVG